MVQVMARYRKVPSVVSRQIAGEFILVPIRKNLGDLEDIYTLNEVASSAWALIDGRRSLGEICDRLVEEYDVEIDRVQADLIELFAGLQAIGAIEAS